MYKLLTVVGVGDVELALVAGVRVNMADQGSLEVVVNIAIRYGNVVAVSGDVQKAIIEVLPRVKLEYSESAIKQVNE